MPGKRGNAHFMPFDTVPTSCQRPSDRSTTNGPPESPYECSNEIEIISCCR